MTSFIALLIASLAVFVGPMVTWAIARQQIAVTAREAWIKEFREAVATLITAYDEFVLFTRTYSSDDPQQQQKLAFLNETQRLPYHKIRLLIAGHDQPHTAFPGLVEGMLQSERDSNAGRRNAVVDAAAVILRKERSIIEDDPGIWSVLRASLKW